MHRRDVIDPDLSWRLLYTKPCAEAWVEANLRNQGYGVLMPRVISRGRVAPLFPRYVFAGVPAGGRDEPLRHTYGVQYVVLCGDHPARVPLEVLVEIGERMDERGMVRVDAAPERDALFAKRERERVRALVKFAAAGFRVRVA